MTRNTSQKTKSTAHSRADIYTRVTNIIVKQLEQGVRPWVKPWVAGHQAGHVSKPLRHNGRPYSGINTVTLWGQSLRFGYDAPLWMTFKQAQELGGHVKKGEKGSPVVYADTFRKEEANDKGELVERDIPFMKGYAVFNIEQIKGLPEHYYAKNEPQTLNTDERLNHVDQFTEKTKATLKHGGGSACFLSTQDLIRMPHYERFESRESYYATLIHELTHWTVHKSRLNRDLSNAFGSTEYASEELIAELGAAFLCSDLKITNEVREDHAAYLASWLKALKNDNRAIFKAAAQAQQAADYLHSLQSKKLVA